MSLEKLIARDVRSKADRDQALGFLRKTYSNAVRGTAWEGVTEMLRERDEARPDDRLELYEVEGRGVSVVWPERGMGHAWMWDNGCWGYAPGLVNKSWLEGRWLTPAQFIYDFPDADLSGIEEIARGALSLNVNLEALWSGGQERSVRDEFIAAGYHLTKHLMRRAPAPFGVIAQKVIDGLGVDPIDALPYIASWYSVAHVDLGEPAGTDIPWEAFQKLPRLRDWLEANAYSDFDEFMCELPLAVDNWGGERCRAVAEKVRAQMSVMPASGIFDRPDHRCLWDEYCLQVQEGPPQLSSAWDLTIDQVIDPLIEEIARSDAVLLTLWRAWLKHDFADSPDHETWNPEAIRTGVLEQLDLLAKEVEQDWVTG
jgi:hypothetical protein